MKNDTVNIYIRKYNFNYKIVNYSTGCIYCSVVIVIVDHRQLTLQVKTFIFQCYSLHFDHSAIILYKRFTIFSTIFLYKPTLLIITRFCYQKCLHWLIWWRVSFIDYRHLVRHSTVVSCSFFLLLCWRCSALLVSVQLLLELQHLFEKYTCKRKDFNITKLYNKQRCLTQQEEALVGLVRISICEARHRCCEYLKWRVF